MPSLAAASSSATTLLASDSTSPSPVCLSTTVQPDANGWVPPGTCGYLSRPYYPSLTTALVFSVAAAAALAGFALRIARRRRGRLTERKTRLWRDILGVPWLGAFISTCLLIAYVLRAFGTRHQQEPVFVAFSDTLILVCPILVFALNCVILTKMIRTSFPHSPLLGLTPQTLSRFLLTLTPLLAVSHLIAAVLIAPKHRPSPSRPSSPTAMLGLQLYLVGIGIHEVLVGYTFAVSVLLFRKFTTTEVTKTVPSMMGANRCGVLYVLLFSLAGVLVRIAYRLVELSAFFTGYFRGLAHREVFFYALECGPVLAALGVWVLVDAERVLETGSAGSMGGGGYEYHEIGEGLAGDDEVGLARVGTG
ncbi:hypothetical protein BU23DRAFT_201500 [Bimuria novae-zelandiae CBS 107.79]|uniref:RTA1-domain-containing protein n=1 Tax=Bimuria novae-zelandiae CBS 107.79 TaxID=1447943 RepID=A0A6A5V0X8_9PLEO|nr:hypothetical protein BU23DRAFT_201500 [Bimuria novae-zelandiae CBS 107.79]